MTTPSDIKFSVIIPLYNKAEYISRAIESVLSQSYSDFEIIVVNDGSQDGGDRIVENIKSEKVTLVNQANAGVSAARNNGAKHAQYRYLAFLDGDDSWQPDFLEKVAGLIREFPNAGIYGTSNNFVYPNGTVVAENFDTLFNGKETGIIENYFQLFADIHKSPFSNSNLCIPKKIYDEFGGYKLGVKLTEDSDLWCRIALKYDLAFNIKPLANYYLALAGSTHSQFQTDEFEVAKTLRNALANGNVKPQYVAGVKKMITFQKLILVKRALLTGNKTFALSKLDGDILKHYPKDAVISLISVFLPMSFINRFRQSKYN